MTYAVETDHPAHWRKERARLETEIRAALVTPGKDPVNVSRFRHSVIAPVLRTLAYDRTLRGASLVVRFDDDTLPPPVPLGLLRPADVTFDPGRVLRVSPMSGRHPEMAYLCHFFVCRNEDIAAAETMADEEAVAFESTVRYLEGQRALEGLGFDGPLVLEVYHTGLEPMVYGFYRAVSHVFRTRGENSRSLVVIPMLYHPPRREEGAEDAFLTPDSPGAKRENYLAATAWV